MTRTQIVILCVVIASLFAYEFTTASRVIGPLGDRLTKAELVVVGELSDTSAGFTIEFPNARAGWGADRWHYAVGTILVEEVLKGECARNDRGNYVARVAFYVGAEREGRQTHFSGLEDLSFRSGDRGVWILRRGNFPRYYGVVGHDCLLNLNMLETVKGLLK